YRSAPGGSTAEPWIHLSDPGEADTTLGVLARQQSNTLWACVVTRAANAPPGPPGQGHSILRAFNLRTGAIKASYPLPGSPTLCNDIAISPDRTVYATDTTNGRVLRLNRRGRKLEVWIEDKRLAGIDGLAFLGPTLYVNNVRTGRIYRIPIAANGKAGALVDVALSQPLKGPDGMRAANGHIFVAENAAGRVSELTFHGDRADVTVLKDGYQMPTAVSPVGGVLWVGEAKLNYAFNPKLRGQDPGPFKAYALPLPR
ncbi:MAG: SMP-30/gluconolactonase/LRE family protein, partial [Steroidobacteraceae bacterium]